jgi:hypothetical protein
MKLRRKLRQPDRAVVGVNRAHGKTCERSWSLWYKARAFLAMNLSGSTDFQLIST